MSPNLHYILNENREVVETEDPYEWCDWFQDSDEKRRVGRDVFDGRTISTVFLAIDHGWRQEDEEPVLWETMVFGPDGSEEMDRCSGTWADAEAMHRRMVEKYRRLSSMDAMEGKAPGMDGPA